MHQQDKSGDEIRPPWHRPVIQRESSYEEDQAWLLSGLLDCARKDGFGAISLSVAKDNPARHLYERYGFQQVREDDGAVVMRAPLSETNS